MKKTQFIYTLIGILFLLGFYSCEKSDTSVTPPDYNNIDTISYDQHVQPLLNQRCAFEGCHDATTKSVGLALTTWNDVIKGSLFGEVLIPYKSSKSLLTSLFDGTPLRKPHPSLGSGALTTAEILFLKRWINNGAKNDLGQIPYPRQGMKTLYVPNQGEDNVAIIDVENLVVCRYIDVGRSPAIDGPHFVVADQQFWYVSLIGTGEVWKFDAQTDSLLDTVRVEGPPALLALTLDGSKLYVSQFMTSSTKKLSVINTTTMEVIKTISVGTMPHGLRINNNGTRLYCANMMSDNISVIDVQTDSVVETIQLAYDVTPFGPPKYMPIELAISPDDNYLLVTCSETHEVRMFNTSTNTLVDSFQVGDQPWHLQFTPTGDYCYVANRRGNSISVIHLPMRHIMQTITTPSSSFLSYPHGCDVSVDGRYIFISNENGGQAYIPRYNIDYSGNVCVIDQFSNQVFKVLEVGKMPTGISIAR